MFLALPQTHCGILDKSLIYYCSSAKRPQLEIRALLCKVLYTYIIKTVPVLLSLWAKSELTVSCPNFAVDTLGWMLHRHKSFCCNWDLSIYLNWLLILVYCSPERRTNYADIRLLLGN